MHTRSRYPAIGEYAIVGDCASVALVSTEGSVDWLCWPRFDSPSIFGALLDAEAGGSFQICPTHEYQVSRCYLPETNVLQTTFTTDTGKVKVTDLLAVAEQEHYGSELWPDHQLLRIVDGLEGEVSLSIVCDPRIDYGRVNPRLTDRGELGYFYNHGSQTLIFRSELPLEIASDRGSVQGTATVRQGDRVRLSLSYDISEPAVLLPLGEFADRKLRLSTDYWKHWLRRMRYCGDYQETVARSALTLKLMTYSASGAVVAAPTTSLPEGIGGGRNWDYRYCWLRDAALTLRALFDLGYTGEGKAFLSWLLHTTRRSLPELKLLYDVMGGDSPSERRLHHLEGYRGSSPVRVGNDAQEQFQLDVYGELISAVYEYVRRGGELGGWQQKLVHQLGDVICERWEEPDDGIWEIRGPRRNHTYSMVMCWAGLDMLMQMADQDALEVPTEKYLRVQERIRGVVERRGYNESLGSYVSVLDGTTVDASLLLLSTYGYSAPGEPRMQGTYELIQERLGQGPLLYRYAENFEDGVSGQEGAFGICSFWGVAYLASLGHLDEAKRRFEELLSYANDVGLFSEEIEPSTGQALGNFPQAFTHVGLINAALRIHEAEHGEQARTERLNDPVD